MRELSLVLYTHDFGLMCGCDGSKVDGIRCSSGERLDASMAGMQQALLKNKDLRFATKQDASPPFVGVFSFSLLT